LGEHDSLRDELGGKCFIYPLDLGSKLTILLIV